MKELHTWINTFHKTSCKSTLSESDASEIEYALLDGLSASHKDARKLRRLEKELCPHALNDCACRAAMQTTR